MHFNQCDSQIRPGQEQRVVWCDLLSEIGNIDEIPLLCEFLDGQTYPDKGSCSVHLPSGKSGWDIWQGTIVFSIFTDGAMRVKPLILYKGVEKVSRKYDIE